MASIYGRIRNRVKRYLIKREYQSTYSFDSDRVADIISKNRESLRKIPVWFDNTILAESVFRYGITDNLLDKLNEPIGNDPTYTDMLCYFADKIAQAKISYLEIGVSVGKNIYQLLNHLNHSTLVGFDIEEINPYLSRNLSQVSRHSWPTSPGSIKRSHSSLTAFRYKANQFDYISADVWDENSWAKLAGRKFNIVFSDALHDPQALLHEHRMIEKYDLLDRSKFVIAWDDLDGGMVDSFIAIKKRLAKTHGVSKSNTYLLRINGWVGQNWGKHNVGVITNIF